MERESKQNCENHYDENTIMSHSFFGLGGTDLL